MLSDREEQELGLIEEGLRDDSHLVASFRNGRRRPLHWRPGIVRLAIVLGLVLTVSGPILAAAGLTLQGLLLTGVSYFWWRYKVKPTLVQPPLSSSRTDRRWWGFPP
jgi:hypothetical protein